MKKRPSLNAIAPAKITAAPDAAQGAPKGEGHKTVAKEKGVQKALNLRFDRDLVRELKLAALNEERSMTAIIGDACWAYLRSRGGMRVLP